MKSPDKVKAGRRTFLKGVAAGSAATVAIVAVDAGAANNAEEPEVARVKSRGYRLTQHVEDYYNTTRR